MTTINSGQFAEICGGVWRDRVKVLTGRDFLSGEAALVRAVYWRLRKAGMKPAGSEENYGTLQTILACRLAVAHLVEVNATPCFDAAPFLKKLVEQYQNEAENVAR